MNIDQAIIQLISIIEDYLKQQMQQSDVLTIISHNWMPIVQVVIILTTAIAGLWKYYTEKNREICEKILSEVYAPFIEYIVKQELYNNLYSTGIDHNDAPILEIIRKTEKFKYSLGVSLKETNEEPVCNLTREFLIGLKQKTNFGLAPKNLLILLDMYELLVNIEKHGNGMDIADPCLKATILKVEVEKALRVEIISGYNKYHEKLGLSNRHKSKLWKITNDNIEFPFIIPDNDIVELREKMQKNPELYIQK